MPRAAKRAKIAFLRTFVELTAVAFYTIEAVITWLHFSSSGIEGIVSFFFSYVVGLKGLLLKLLKRGDRLVGDPFGALSEVRNGLFLMKKWAFWQSKWADVPLLLRLLRLHPGCSDLARLGDLPPPWEAKSD